jgi:hypothetical protein
MGNEGAIPHSFRIFLTDETRKKSHGLVLLGMLSIGMAWTGVSPERIVAIGIDFGKINPKALYWVMIIALFYFLVGFVVYAIYDGLEIRAQFWKMAIDEHKKEAAEVPPQPGKPKLRPSAVQFYEAKLFHNPAHKTIYVMRILYDCVIPVAIGAVAISGLFKNMPG